MSREKLESFPKTQLTLGPSPIHKLEWLADHLGREVEIHAKREDLNSSLAYGGNKTAEIEHLEDYAPN